MSDDRWTVYGRAKAGLDMLGIVQFRGVHLDRAPSLEMANSFVEDAIKRYGQACVTCVIVELRHGVDHSSTRRVIRRVGEGRAWWE